MVFRGLTPCRDGRSLLLLAGPAEMKILCSSGARSERRGRVTGQLAGRHAGSQSDGFGYRIENCPGGLGRYDQQGAISSPVGVSTLLHLVSKLARELLCDDAASGCK